MICRPRSGPAAVGIFTGVLAKEAVVGTLDAMYTAMAEVETVAEDQTAETFDLWQDIEAAYATIPANLAEALTAWRDPLGVSIRTASDPAIAAAEQEVAPGTFGAMAARFDGTAGAFAYLLFILLYAPCTATLAAVYREIGLAWAGFVALWTTCLAYMVSTVYFQAAVFSRHPKLSTLWIVGLLAAFWAVIIGLKRFALRGMLAIFERKGRIRQITSELACGNCNKCDPAMLELYEWIDRK